MTLWLTTRRSKVQILPPQPEILQNIRQFYESWVDICHKKNRSACNESK